MGEFAQDLNGAIDRGALFIRGDQVGQPPMKGGVGLEECLGGRDKGRQRRLHVCGASAHQCIARMNLGFKRAAGPGLERARWHHIGVAGEHQGGPGQAALTHGPEVGHLTKEHDLCLKAQGLESGRDELAAALVSGGDRRPANQFSGEGNGSGVGGRHVKRLS